MNALPAAGGCRPVVFLVEEQSNPTTDYYLVPAFAARDYAIVRRRLDDPPPEQDLHGATVVFVRYLSPQWAAAVERARPRLKRLICFLDDDLLDYAAAAGLPWRYRLKLALRSTRWRGWLARQGAELWVSTPYLRDKYAAWSPHLLPANPAAVAAPRDEVCVFYHGSASHGAEIRWLQPVAAAALAQEERLCFEIVGGAEVNELYRRLPRTRVVHPMKWQSYRSFLAAPGRHVGLAPQLDAPFNRARSYAKFCDITRCGAVGIYSPGSLCAAVVDDGRDGLVVALREEAWVEAILRLVRDAALRSTLLAGAERKLLQLQGAAQERYAALLPD